MDNTGVRINVWKENEFSFEDAVDKSKDLKELITALKETQCRVNEFLSLLVDGPENDLTKDEADDLDSGPDEDSAENFDGLEAKKCKLSD